MTQKLRHFSPSDFPQFLRSDYYWKKAGGFKSNAFFK